MHVHLMIPILDEGDFWDMHSDSSAVAGGSKTTISLLVVRAMIFAACNFVPLPVLQELGYHDVSTARADLYRKTKLLFDLEIESGHLPRAQSALLLMGWIPNSLASNPSPVPWRMWLSRAIHHARQISAHRHTGIAEGTTGPYSSGRPSSATLRRLWWSCIIMDRVAPLCARFRLQITSDMLDSENCVPLGFGDLEGEIYRSKVFPPETKRRLIGIFMKLMDLMMLLTDVLPIAFPFEASLEAGSSFRNDAESKIVNCRKQLANWYEAVRVELPVFHGSSEEHQQDSVVDPTNCTILYTNLVYIYYHTSCLMLCNLEIFGQISQQVAGNSQICYKIVRNVIGITQCVSALTHYNLIMYLPVTVLACLATPLALYIATARLSPIDGGSASTYPDTWSDMDMGSDQNRLDALMQAVDSFYPEHHTAQWVKETAYYAANHSQSYNQALAQSGEEAMRDWVHMLMAHPSEYLRLIWTVDLCISRTKLPESHDFPQWLRGTSLAA
ncbi:fungal specific transcription factor domain-containing protein [Sarocladium implicatum]|nr:fungal specific transcription factor domain-containing protein [Sarocladium implicatum]